MDNLAPIEDATVRAGAVFVDVLDVMMHRFMSVFSPITLQRVVTMVHVPPPYGDENVMRS